MAIVGLAAIGDWYARNTELDALLDAVQRSEESMKFGAGNVARAREAVTAAQLDAKEQAAEVYFDRTESAAEAVKDTGRQVGEVRTLPWHFALRRAQNAYVEHSDAWADVFVDLAAGRSRRDTEIGPTFRAARRAFDASVPLYPLGEPAGRISKVFAE